MKNRIWVHIALFALTFCTTLVAGSFMALGIPLENPEAFLLALRQAPANLLLGLSFSVPLLSVLVIHELGHYTAARHHRVDVTPPFFIPAPSMIGTLGAFIRIKSPVPHRNALMDVGAAGPIAGAVVAVPVLLAGLKMSSLVPIGDVPASEPRLGVSLIVRLAAYLVFGDIPAGQSINLHPMAFAGWIGLLVTALNLLPSGQLDGGHIAYALFGGKYTEPARLVPYFLLFLGLLWWGWFLWAGMLFLMGTKHPRTVFDEDPLSRGRRITGYAAILLFLLCFMPNPVPM